MTIVDALKELFVKFGGNETDFDAETVSQALDQISDVAESGGGGYDGKIRLTFADGGISGGILESGTYDSILNVLDTKKAANIIVYEQAEAEFGDTILSYNPTAVFITRGFQEPAITVVFNDSELGHMLAILPDNTVVAEY